MLDLCLVATKVSKTTIALLLALHVSLQYLLPDSREKGLVLSKPKSRPAGR